MKTAIRILFNDSNNNYPGSKHVTEGGREIFSKHFTAYFKNTPHHLLSVFFFPNKENPEEIEHRTVLSKKQHDYIEILLPPKKLPSTFKGTYTKKEYISLFATWFDEVEQVFNETSPDVVFLNGYSFPNYVMFTVAKKLGIPVCIQHAGIWIKEINAVSTNAISASVQKIFASIEKDVTTYNAHHIFLNEHTKDHFLKAHKLTPDKLHATSIVPLPIAVPKAVREVTLKKKASKPLSIIAVSRWDAIKNHSAILRLAEYIHDQHIAATVSVVTNAFNGAVSEFRDKYIQYVDIVAPMDSKKLVSFYRASDILILPSRFETLGGVVMEALMQGKPSIISDQTGWVSEYKKFGLDKFIISPEASGEEIHDAINELFSHPAKYVAKFARLQKYIIDRQLPHHVLPKYEKIFINLSKKHHG